MGVLRWILCVCLACAGLPIYAQSETEGQGDDEPPGFRALGSTVAEFPIARSQEPLLTLDQERMFTESQFGRRVAEELSIASEMLSRENRAIEAELTSEERSLTEQRGTLPAEEFRALADAFDDKVVGFRRTQDRKALALQRRDEAEQQVFLRAALPILAELVSELGAVAILDTRAVLVSAQSVDVTDRAIARIDAEIGPGQALSPQGPILPADDTPLSMPEVMIDEDPPNPTLE